MTGILERWQENKEIIKRLAERGYFDSEEVEILRKLGLLDG